MKNLKLNEKLELLDKAILLEKQNQDTTNKNDYQGYYKEMVTLVTEENQSKLSIKILNIENFDEKALKELQIQLEILNKAIDLEKHT